MILSIDFDDTIAKRSRHNKKKLIPIDNVIEFIQNKYNNGFELHIITARSNKDFNRIAKFCEINNIKVKSIICVEGKNKIPFIKQISSILHIDNNLDTCNMCISENIQTIFVDWQNNKIPRLIFLN